MSKFISGCGTIAASLLVFWLVAVTAGIVAVARNEIVIGVRGVVRTAGQAMQVIMWAGPTMIVVVVVVVVGLMISKRRNENMRAKDGQYAAQWARVGAGFWPWQRGDRVWFDPNDLIGWGARIGSDGVHEIDSVFTNASDQLEAFRIKQARNAIQAMYPGDDAHIESETPVKPPTASASNKVLSGAGKQIKVLDPEPKQLATPADMPGIAEGLQNDTPRSFAIGYDDNGTVARWRAEQNPHLRVHGKSQGSGKTNLLKSIASAALAKGAHVIVVDRRRFKDWQDFKGRAELVDSSDPVNFANAIINAHREFERRDRMIGAAGVPNIEGLSGESIARIIMIISEFGATWGDAKADKLTGDIEKPLIDMARMSGATGVHMLFEDQTPDKGVWPRALASNATPVAGYNDKMYGTLVGHDKPHTIPAYSFSFDGADPFRTWDMTAPDAKKLIGRLPMLNGYRVMGSTPDAPVYAVREPVQSPFTESSLSNRGSLVPNSDRTASEQPIEQPHQRERTPVNAIEPERTERTGGANTPNTPPPTPPFTVRSADKRIAVQWFMDNVSGTQKECRDWFAANGGSVSRGYVSQVYNGQFDNVTKSRKPSPPAPVAAGVDWPEFTDDWFMENLNYLQDSRGGMSALAAAMAAHGGEPEGTNYKLIAMPAFLAFVAEYEAHIKDN